MFVAERLQISIQWYPVEGTVMLCCCGGGDGDGWLVSQSVSLVDDATPASTVVDYRARCNVDLVLR